MQVMEACTKVSKQVGCKARERVLLTRKQALVIDAGGGGCNWACIGDTDRNDEGEESRPIPMYLNSCRYDSCT